MQTEVQTVPVHQMSSITRLTSKAFSSNVSSRLSSRPKLSANSTSKKSLSLSMPGQAPVDKTPNHSSLNLLNFTKVALQTGKDSLRGLLLGSQVLRACGESQIRLRRVKGAERLPLSCPTILIHLHHLYRTSL